jgi:hypothetical protein
MSKAKADQLKTIRAELVEKLQQTCDTLDKSIAAEEAENEAKKSAIDYEGTRLVREVAFKSEGRTGTLHGVMAARMLPKRGGPPNDND